MSMASIPYTGSIRHNCSTEDPTQRRGNKKKSLHSVQTFRGSWCYAKALGLYQLGPINSTLAHLGINTGQKPFLTGISHTEEDNLVV